MTLDPSGIAADVRFIASPNFDERPPGAKVDLLVIHNISLPPGDFGGPAIVDLFTNRLDPAAHPYYAGIAQLRVSAHFLVRRDGEIIQFVPCRLRAWHAGESTWCGKGRCNDYSIGIEVEGADDQPFAAIQYEQLARLTRMLLASYPGLEIVGHSDIAPGRKTDPGPCFDWVRYRNLAP
ncbi:MAG: negative regulator of AmpC, AmpD [Betaproteobacteria bacterium]|nr:negative regulator of AmpC, AmpD [Betaproteobacteria bacterium]